MNRFRWFILSLTAVFIVILVLVSKASTSRVEAFPAFTPPGRLVLASPPPIALRGEGLATTEVPEDVPTPEVSQPTSAKPSSTKTPVAPKPVPSKTPAAPPATPACAGSFSQEFICLLNQYRKSKGLGSVSYNPSLANVALQHSTWMSRTGIFSHEESDGSHLLDRCRAAGTICRAENLARGVSSPQKLLDMWIASASHNKNLLGPYTTAGLGSSGNYITLLLN